MVLPLEGLAGEPGAPAAEPALAVLRYEQVAVALTEGVALYDRAGRLLDVNDAFRALLGLDAASGAAAVLLADLVDEHGRPTAGHDHPVRRAALTGRLVSGLVVGVRAPAGDRRWLRVTALPTRCDDGTPVVVLTGSDVTGERSASQALLAAENRFRLAAEHAPIGIVIVSPEGVLLDVNDALCRLLDYSREELTGRTFAEITHPEDLALDVAHVQRLLAGEAETYRLEKRYVAQDGRVLWAQLSVALARDDDGRPLYFVSMIEDITAERAAASALAHRVLHDSLTGLPNRAFLLDKTEAALARAAPGRAGVALLFCDLDQFKLINDSRGHQAGDAVLVETAQRLRDCVRGVDTAARLGGDEFVVLCEDLASRTEAEAIAQRLIDVLTEPMRRAGGLTMTVSIGIAFSGPGVTAADLLRNADAAMYLAKGGGRDRYALFTPELIAAATERLDLEHSLREAMGSEDLYLDYQPVRRLSDGAVAGHEALLRWAHPVRGVLTPQAFLPVAEDSDLVLEIDRYVLARACRAAVTWGDDTGISVNVSGRHVGRGLLPGLVARTLRDSRLAPGRLVLEITETALMGMTPTAQSELDTLVHLGVRLAIDDFGTGYSSLKHLVEVPAAFVKIDRSFIAAMDHSPANRAVVEAVISLARALGIDVIAEGIEEEGQRVRLTGLGCGFGQGYLLGRPAASIASS